MIHLCPAKGILHPVSFLLHSLHGLTVCQRQLFGSNINYHYREKLLAITLQYVSYDISNGKDKKLQYFNENFSLEFILFYKIEMFNFRNVCIYILNRLVPIRHGDNTI